MATINPASLLPEIGPDGLPREATVIAYTEKIIEAEQLQLRKYIEENYSKIRDVERELANLTFELKLTAGPKKAALEHLRKKIELLTERILAAKLNEEQAWKAWEEASKAVKDAEAIKLKLCDDLNQLVQESSNTQFSRLEELKRRLEALNPSRASMSDTESVQPAQIGTTAPAAPSKSHATESSGKIAENICSQENGGNVPLINIQNQQLSVEGEGKVKKKSVNSGRVKEALAVSMGRGSTGPSWTGAGFDVGGRT